MKLLSGNRNGNLVSFAASIAVFAIGGPLLISPAAAITFEGTYDITYNNQDPGLVVHVDTPQGTLDPFTLEEGESTGWFPLFDIWTEECCVNSDDRAPQPIEVTYAFTEPAPGFDDTISGETKGGASFFGLIEWGRVTWNDPISLTFGNGGLLLAYLSDETFNAGFIDLGTHGATVNAKFVLEVAPVPLPPALVLFVGGLAAMGYLTARRNLKNLNRGA